MTTTRRSPAADPPPAYVCVWADCGARSWNPNDGIHRYCGRCHRYADPIDVDAVLAELERLDELHRTRLAIGVLVAHERALLDGRA